MRKMKKVYGGFYALLVMRTFSDNQNISYFFLKAKPNSYKCRIDEKFEQIGFGGMDEKSILKRLQNRDEKAFEEIIDLYSAYITAIVRNLLSSKGTKEDVEEVVADTFISLWNTVERINYEEYSSIKAYIAVIARNKAKDWLRNAKVQSLQLRDDILIIDNSVEQLIVQREQQRIIAKILEQLKPLDWKIFVAYYYQYKKVNEIAQEFQMNPQTVKTRLQRGREALKKFLIKEGYESNAD